MLLIFYFDLLSGFLERVSLPFIFGGLRDVRLRSVDSESESTVCCRLEFLGPGFFNWSHSNFVLSFIMVFIGSFLIDMSSSEPCSEQPIVPLFFLLMLSFPRSLSVDI